MSDTEVNDRIVEDYLRRLDSALARLPRSRRRELVADIAEHISQGRSELPQESEVSIRQLLDRLGEPEAIAEALEVSDREGVRPRRLSMRLVAVAVAVLALATSGVALDLVVTTPGTSGQLARNHQELVNAERAIRRELRQEHDKDVRTVVAMP